MSSIDWFQFIDQHISKGAKDYLVLEPGASTQELEHIEQTQGLIIDNSVRHALSMWKEHGSDTVLIDVPAIINPSLRLNQLLPTGMGMHELFPDFCQILAQTKHFAVLVTPQHQYEELSRFLFAGSSKDDPGEDAGRYVWTYHIPASLEAIRTYERRGEFSLSPQMLQMYLHSNGVPFPARCPYVYPIQFLKKGTLTEVYRPLWDQLNSEEAFTKMETFVTFYDDTAGNEDGLFSDQRGEDGEYMIYGWDHEVARFDLLATSFAQWFQQKHDLYTEELE